MKINILGIDYKIEEFDEPELLGDCSLTKQRIRMNKNIVDEHTYDATLLHEVVHLISNNLQLGLTEEQVSGLAAGLYQTYKIKHKDLQ